METKDQTCWDPTCPIILLPDIWCWYNLYDLLIPLKAARMAQFYLMCMASFSLDGAKEFWPSPWVGMDSKLAALPHSSHYSCSSWLTNLWMGHEWHTIFHVNCSYNWKVSIAHDRGSLQDRGRGQESHWSRAPHQGWHGSQSSPPSKPCW